MKNFEKVEAIRQKISGIRGELQDLLLEDNLWEGWLTPSIGASTCILQSLYDAVEEMKKHDKRWKS